jgi:beta-glucanase (GH16 family)
MRRLLSAALAVTALASLAAFAEVPAHAASRPAATAQKASTNPLPPNYKLVFNSDFAKTSAKGTVNPETWATCYPWATAAGCTNFGNAKLEKEWYLPSQVKVAGGILKLTATRTATKGLNAKGKPATYACRSGMVTTYPSLHFKYGFVQVKARLPFSPGLWPAFWLAAANGKWPPEIDILEHWDAQPYSKVYLHPLSGVRQGTVYSAPTADKGLHVFEVKWTKSSLTWYYDNKKVFATSTGVPQQAMYLIMNLADTTTAKGACSSTMQVASVKVWQAP